jgi:hypothetical protein
LRYERDRAPTPPVLQAGFAAASVAVVANACAKNAGRVVVHAAIAYVHPVLHDAVRYRRAAPDHDYAVRERVLGLAPHQRERDHGDP